jgi:hypothetical protein
MGLNSGLNRICPHSIHEDGRAAKSGLDTAASLSLLSAIPTEGPTDICGEADTGWRTMPLSVLMSGEVR